ncbi:MAG: hypothetical protein EXR80_01810 [Methylococcales bacterium]|nr:hypothetical protein [Methylococcales bacterium]
MKLINPLIAVLVLVASCACSKETPQPEPPKAEESGIIHTQTGRIESGKKTLEDAKQGNQVLLDSAAQQHETIENSQQ